MNIFEEEPKNWLDLQDKVAYVLEHCGYSVETPKLIQTSRGCVEVDVYAESKDMIIVCECKYWESNIPQNIAFAFRTIVEDIGANKGIIIAKKGFQSGVYCSIKNTNIETHTWNEFMELYKEKYLKTVIRQFTRIQREVFRLAYDKEEYWEYFDKLNIEQQKYARTLQNQLLQLYHYVFFLCEMLRNEEDEEVGWNMEFVDILITKSEESLQRKFGSYSSFFEYINVQIYESISKFEELYKIEILSIK